MRHRWIARAVLAALAMCPAVAAAQGTQGGGAPTASAPSVSGASSAAPATGAAPAPVATAAPAPATASVSPTGASHRGATARSLALPGFETMGDGSTRLFVELTKPVAYETKIGRSSLTYILKGAGVARRNSCNPLVTVHFNTPVTSARLVPHGRDLWFVVQLRAKVQPTVNMEPAKDGSAVMQIDLPKGDYLPAHEAEPKPGAEAPPTSGEGAPKNTPPAR